MFAIFMQANQKGSPGNLKLLTVFLCLSLVFYSCPSRLNRNLATDQTDKIKTLIVTYIMAIANSNLLGMHDHLILSQSTNVFLIMHFSFLSHTHHIQFTITQPTLSLGSAKMNKCSQKKDKSLKLKPINMSHTIKYILIYHPASRQNYIIITPLLMLSIKIKLTTVIH